MGYWIAIGCLIPVTLFCCTSWIFRRYPLIIHRKKDIKFTARHISHRGGAGENLENTMLAFAYARDECQTDMFEIDCHLTRDNVVVISHDDDLKRVCGKNCLISSTNYDDLPELLETLDCTFGDGPTIGGPDKKIPRLRELFEKYPDVPVNIDVKEDSLELIRAISQLVDEFQRHDTTVWGNFRAEVVRKCRQVNPRIQTLFPMRSVFQISILYVFGILPFVPLQHSFYEVLLPSAILKHNVYDSHGLKARVAAWLVDMTVINKKLLAHLQQRGIQVYIWVCNTDGDFHRALLNLGADGVMTDYPSRLRRWIDHHEMSHSLNKHC